MDVFNRLGLAFWNSWFSLPFPTFSFFKRRRRRRRGGGGGGGAEEEEEEEKEEVVETGARENFPL